MYHYDENGNLSKRELINYKDDNGYLINPDKDKNRDDRWPGQDDWEKDKSNYDKQRAKTTSNNNADIGIGVIAVGLIIAIAKLAISISVPGGVIVYAIP